MKSKLKAILDDDRGVSPVIGVILMVAITVILAAVIGTFVLNLGGNLQSTPQAQLSVDKVDGNLVINHNGGDALQASNFRVQHEDPDGNTNDVVWTDELSVGSSYDAVTSAATGEHTITVIHEPSDSILIESTVTIA